MNKLISVKNKTNQRKKFWDRHIGCWIFVQPGETVLTSTPPEESEIFGLKEQTEKKEKSKKPEEDDV